MSTYSPTRGSSQPKVEATIIDAFSPVVTIARHSGLFSLVNASLLAILAETFEAKDTVHLCEQGIVAADADIYAGMDVSTTLANEDVACQYILTIRRGHDILPKKFQFGKDTLNLPHDRQYRDFLQSSRNRLR